MFYAVNPAGGTYLFQEIKTKTLFFFVSHQIFKKMICFVYLCPRDGWAWRVNKNKYYVVSFNWNYCESKKSMICYKL